MKFSNKHIKNDMIKYKKEFFSPNFDKNTIK